MRKFFLLLILIFSCSFLSFSQTFNSDESAKIDIPEYALKDVVQRILIWNFKPRKQKKIIYLSDKLIDKTWLPEIKNIEFQFLSDDKIDEGNKVYFFKIFEKLNKHYQIGFGFGDPNCNHFGTTWGFRILKNRIKLLTTNSGFGGGCGGSRTTEDSYHITLRLN